jgi:hypothetical protein
MTRLGAEESDRFDVGNQPLLAQLQDRLRGVGNGKQFGGGLVDADISGLGREDHCYQQLEGRPVVQLGGGVRIGFPQPGKDRCPLGWVHLG